MRGRASSVSIDVDIDVDEVIAQISNEDLLAEIRDRNLSVGMILGLEESVGKIVLADLRQGRVSDAITLLERTLWPKFASHADCAKAVAKVTGARQ